jgi:HEAT repeat protein
VSIPPSDGGPARPDPAERLPELIAAAQADPASPATVALIGLGRPAVDAVVAALASEPVPGRRHQLVGLLEELAPGHLDRIEAALDGAPWYLARNLAAVLGRVGRVEHLPILEGLLAHDHAAVRRESVRGMVRLGAVLATAPLAARAGDPDAGVRRLALHGLAEIDTPTSLAVLAQATRRGRPLGERRLALTGLARSARPEAEAVLREAATRLALSAASRRLRAHARALLATRPRPTVTFR